METSTASRTDDFPLDRILAAQPLERYPAVPLPPGHPLEHDTFARHQGVPGHDQQKLAAAHVLLIGGGGLNGWAGVGLARSGVRKLTVVDADTVDRTNLARQVFFGDDLGTFKGPRLARNLAEHMVAGGEAVGIALPFPQAGERFDLRADLMVVGVDNNTCRLAAVQQARRWGIPAVFTMLSLDGMRCQCFLQGPRPEDPCLWCALPNLDPERAAPCAAAIVTSCLLASAYTVFFAHRAVMGWPAQAEAFNWREADLLGAAPERVGRITRRATCPVCANGGR